MGFPSIRYGIMLPKPLGVLLDICAHVKLMVRLALFYLGLFDPSDLSPWEDHGDRVPVLGPSSQSSAPITSELVKKSLPIIEFTDFIKRSGVFKDEDEDEDESISTVCLSSLEGGHEIRELCNCSHVFHVGCLDIWVDQGHITCPLCRSNLLPEEDVRKGSKSSILHRCRFGSRVVGLRNLQV